MTGRRSPAPAPTRRERLVEAVGAGLRSRGTPERAEAEKAYLKSGLAHYGVTVPGVRAVATAVCTAKPDLSRDDLLGTADALWRRPGARAPHGGRGAARPLRRPAAARRPALPRAAGAGVGDLGAGMREAIKSLSEAQRAAVLAARGAPPASRGRGSHRVR